MFVIKINDDVIIDGTKFISFYDDHFPDFSGDNSEVLFTPKIIDDTHVELFGYSINVQSTVFPDLNAHELQNRLLKMRDDSENFFRAFFNLEIYNYSLFRKGDDAFFFPSLDFIKFVFWNYEAFSIPRFEGRVRKLNTEILSKSELVLSTPTSKGQSINSAVTRINYFDLLDTTSNFCSELTFARLCQLDKYKISDGGTHDFIINNDVIAEVKNIHDKIPKGEINTSSNVIKNKLSDSYTSEELKETILSEITRKKWIDHVQKGIKQNGDIVFFNVTQSPGLYEFLLFLEQSGTKKSFKEIMDEAMRLKTRKDCTPIIVMMENIHSKLMRSFFFFTAPTLYKNNIKELDLLNYDHKHLRNTIVF